MIVDVVPTYIALEKVKKKMRKIPILLVLVIAEYYVSSAPHREIGPIGLDPFLLFLTGSQNQASFSTCSPISEHLDCINGWQHLTNWMLNNQRGPNPKETGKKWFVEKKTITNTCTYIESWIRLCVYIPQMPVSNNMDFRF